LPDTITVALLNQGGAGMESWLVPALIPCVVAIIAIIINWLCVRATLRHALKREFGKISLDYKIRQLNELYGPLLMMIEQNTRLHKKLCENKRGSDEWRLVDHIPDVLANPEDRAIVDEIMGINSTIEELIQTKAGFIRAPRPPESFSLYLAHYRILRLAYDQKGMPQGAQAYPYPRDLNNDVREAYNSIQREIAGLMSLWR